MSKRKQQQSGVASLAWRNTRIVFLNDNNKQCSDGERKALIRLAQASGCTVDSNPGLYTTHIVVEGGGCHTEAMVATATAAAPGAVLVHRSWCIDTNKARAKDPALAAPLPVDMYIFRIVETKVIVLIFVIGFGSEMLFKYYSKIAVV